MNNVNSKQNKTFLFLIFVLLVFVVNVGLVRGADEPSNNPTEKQIQEALNIVMGGSNTQGFASALTTLGNALSAAQTNPGTFIQAWTGFAGKATPEQQANVYNNLKDNTQKNQLLNALKNEPKRNDLVKAVLNDQLKKTEKNAKGLEKVNLKGVSLEATKDGIKVKDGPELTVDKWSKEINVNKDVSIQGVYTNQGTGQPDRIINFPKDAKTLLDKDGNYNGVNILYGTGGVINIGKEVNGLNTYEFIKNNPNDQPAIAVGSGDKLIIFSGVSGASVSADKNGNVVGSKDTTQAWFNIKYGTDQRTSNDFAYAIIKGGAGESMITDASKFTKGVLLKTDSSGFVTGIDIKDANGVHILAGESYTGSQISVTATGNNKEVMIARFSDGKIHVKAGSLNPITFQGNIGGFVSSDLLPQQNPGEEGDEGPPQEKPAVGQGLSDQQKKQIMGIYSVAYARGIVSQNPDTPPYGLPAPKGFDWVHEQNIVTVGCSTCPGDSRTEQNGYIWKLVQKK